MQKNKAKVLLIHPEISRTKYNFVGIIENECLELEYISSILKEKGHEVFLYDGQVETIGIPKTLKKVNPDIVYVCGRTRQENFMLEYCKDAKEYNSEIITIIGGLHAQLCYERMYQKNVDFILTTFDIYKILDMIDYSFYHKKINLKTIDGICYQENGNWIHNQTLPFDINRLPRPDRTYFDNHPKNYRYLELEHAAWVRTAYSCPYRCYFCERNRMNSGKYVTRDIEDVVNEIEEIQSNNIYIVDDDFLFNEERLKKFIHLLKQKKIKKNYICYGRSDFIATHKELMKELKSIGLYYVLVGLEAISDDYLNQYNKKSNIKNNMKSIEICNSLKINIMGMFITDLNYTKKDFKNLYQWIKEHKLKHVAISIYTPEMGLETFSQYKNRMITNNPSHFDYLHLVAKPTKLSVKKYYFYYYILLIKLALKAKKEGVYDFIDYKDYIHSFIWNIFRKRRNDDE